MTKLTDTQTLILTRASARPGNLALPLPEGLRGAAAKMAIGRMIKLGFIEEVEANLDLHRFCSGHVLMLGGPLFEGHW